MTMLTTSPARPSGEAPPAPPAPSSMPVERVEAELCTLAGQIAAATCRFLVLLADFDARRGWATWNVRSCAHWLSWRCGLDLRTAREHVRVARALVELPRVHEAFATGRLSYSKVRAVARVATPDNEADLLVAALAAPAAHVERLTRGVATAQRYRAEDEATPGDVVDRTSDAYVRWRWDEDGSLVVWGRLAPEDGARVLAALTRADAERRATAATRALDGSAEPPRRSPDVVPGPPPDAAAALVAMAELTCAVREAPAHAPGAEVMVHVSVHDLVDAPPGPLGYAEERVDDSPQVTSTTRRQGAPHVDDGPPLPLACVQRLACEGRVALTVHGSDGRTLDIGRWRRRPTSVQRGALWRRDRGCAVPGCGRVRFLHAHHVVPWARGGRTSLDNLVLLCGEHHRALHERAFTVVALGRQRFRFHGPGGATFAQAPVTRGSADAVSAAHAEVHAGTIEPDWLGDPLDLPWAVATLLPPPSRAPVG